MWKSFSHGREGTTPSGSSEQDEAVSEFTFREDGTCPAMTEEEKLLQGELAKAAEDQRERRGHFSLTNFGCDAVASTTLNVVLLFHSTN